MSVSRDFEPALPFAMEIVGSDSEFQDCASPTASASGLMGTFSVSIPRTCAIGSGAELVLFRFWPSRSLKRSRRA